MSMIYNKGLYPDTKLNSNDFSSVRTFKVTQEYAYNPLKVVLTLYGSLENADALWMMNHIRNPFKELMQGVILKVPYLQGLSRNAASAKQAAPLKSMNIKIQGKSILY